MESLLNEHWATTGARAEDVSRRVEEVARKIFEENPDLNPLELEAIMVGAVHFVGCLTRIHHGLNKRKAERDAKSSGGRQGDSTPSTAAE